MVWVEAEAVVERLNRDHATTALLLQQAVSSVLTKKGASAFDKTIKRLTNNG